jgi:hypothetical protein
VIRALPDRPRTVSDTAPPQRASNPLWQPAAGLRTLGRFLTTAALMARLACQRLDVNWELCMHLWLNRPVIEVVLEDPAARRRMLARRVNEMFPF